MMRMEHYIFIKYVYNKATKWFCFFITGEDEFCQNQMSFFRSKYSRSNNTLISFIPSKWNLLDVLVRYDELCRVKGGIFEQTVDAAFQK